MLANRVCYLLLLLLLATAGCCLVESPPPGKVSALQRFAKYARASYCGTNSSLAYWSCGPACKTALPDFMPSYAGGDGSGTQHFVVGYDPTIKSIVVVYQGTSSLGGWMTNLNFDQGYLVDTFPGAPTGVRVHSGFQKEHAKNAKLILTKVEDLIAKRNAAKVVVTGHNVGGALASLQALYLRLYLPTTVQVTAVTFGQPRVGDLPFAQFFDSKQLEPARVVYANDPIPDAPWNLTLASSKYRHFNGEIHMLADKRTSLSCIINNSGTVDLDDRCRNQTTRDGIMNTLYSQPNSETIFGRVADIPDHSGPYGVVMIGASYCTAASIQNEMRSV